MMNAGILIVEYTMMTEREFGTMWRRMVCEVDAPMLLAASTYSWFLRLMI